MKVDKKEFDEDLNLLESKLDKLRKDLENFTATPIIEEKNDVNDMKILNIASQCASCFVKAASEKILEVVKSVSESLFSQKKVFVKNGNIITKRLERVEKKYVSRWFLRRSSRRLR